MPNPSVTRALDAIIDVVEGERSVVATINTDRVDRFKTVILPKGMQRANYLKNPVVLLNHDGKKLPIARCMWIKSQPDRIVAKIQFTPEHLDETADKVFRLYQLGYLNAWSIFFDPISYGRPTSEELRARPDWAAAETIYRVWDLLEISAVTIPGNADCLAEACSRGLALPGWEVPAPRPSPGPSPATPPAGLPRLVARSFDQVLAATIRAGESESRAACSRAMQDARELARGMV